MAGRARKGIRPVKSITPAIPGDSSGAFRRPGLTRSDLWK